MSSRMVEMGSHGLSKDLPTHPCSGKRPQRIPSAEMAGNTSAVAVPLVTALEQPLRG